MVEDNAIDADLELRQIKRAGIDCEAIRIETREDFIHQMDVFNPDIILSDFSLPKFDGISAVKIARERRPEIPFIFVSGTIGEETAIESLKEGAVDYIIKTNLSRLPSAINSALTHAEEKKALKRVGQELEKSNQMFRVFMQNLPAVALIKDINSNYLFANQHASDVLQIPIETILGANTNALFPPDIASKFEDMHRQSLTSGTAIQKTFALRRDDGPETHWIVTTFPLWDEKDARHHVGVIAIDITEQKKAEEALVHQANYDSVTGLANRNLLKERLKQAFSECRRNQWTFTIAFIDVDNFKRVNDSLGHSAGDELIRMLGQRLSICIRDTDTIARVGGDEFVILLNNQAMDENYHAVLGRIREELKQPFIIAGTPITATCSIGLATFPRDGDNAETLLANADSAMYMAKANGRNNYQFYAKEMNASLGEHLALEQDLWYALERNELILHYQPQINIATGEIIGIEALIRWQHPKLGMVPPQMFISIAEDNGLIIPIGQWVLETACMQNRILQDAGLKPVRVAVNLSARQLGQKNLIQMVRDTLLKTGLHASYLELEITESMIMHNVEDAIVILSHIHDLGVELSLDDFGTGYSSLSYLKRFPINRLKIDKSFIRDIATDPNDAIIACTIIALAHSMQLHVVAEGVETQDQWDFLKQNQCDEIQGYYFSKPLPFEAIQQLLAQHQQSA